MRIATYGEVIRGVNIARPAQGLLGKEATRSEKLIHRCWREVGRIC